MSWPKNKDEWWALLDEHWDHVLNIMWRFLPMYDIVEQVPPFSSAPAKNMYHKVCDYKRERNPEISQFLSEAWWRAPDHASIHGIPGWDVLCDLCSENYVLYDEAPDETSDISNQICTDQDNLPRPTSFDPG